MTILEDLYEDEYEVTWHVDAEDGANPPYIVIEPLARYQVYLTAKKARKLCKVLKKMCKEIEVPMTVNEGQSQAAAKLWFPGCGRSAASLEDVKPWIGTTWEFTAEGQSGPSAPLTIQGYAPGDSRVLTPRGSWSMNDVGRWNQVLDESPTVDWATIRGWMPDAKYVAMDESGAWDVFDSIPKRTNTLWRLLGQRSGLPPHLYPKFEGDWKDSLIEYKP